MPAYRAAHLNAFRGYDRDRHTAAKLGAFAALGGPICRDCGEDEFEFLTLGHLNGDGAEDRSAMGRRQIYLDIARGVRSACDYAVQCRNCNSGGNLDLCHTRLPESKHKFSGDPCRKCGSPKLIRTSAHSKYGTRKRTECRVCERAEHAGLRSKALSFLGGECACCHVTEPTFLTVDHVNNDGSSLRKTDHCGTPWFYKRLLSSVLDSRLYQTLCWNCNYSKHVGDGICVHNRKEMMTHGL